VALPQLPLKPYTRRTATDSSNKRRTRPEYFLHGSNPRLDYEACEQPEEADYYNYYVGIYDPATSSVQLHLAPKVHITSSIKAHRQHDLEVQDKGARKNVRFLWSPGTFACADGPDLSIMNNERS